MGSYCAGSDYNGDYDPTLFVSPEIVCTEVGGTVTTITLTGTPSEDVTVTIIDGDPPYLARVQNTEPAPRGEGDLWFNPDTGRLSVFVEDV